MDYNIVDVLSDLQNLLNNYPILNVALKVASEDIKQHKISKNKQKKLNNIYTIYENLSKLVNDNKILMDLVDDTKSKEIYKRCGILNFAELRELISNMSVSNTSVSELNNIYDCIDSSIYNLQNTINKEMNKITKPYDITDGETEAAERKAREEAEAAERKAREEAEATKKAAAERKAREEAERKKKAAEEAEAARKANVELVMTLPNNFVINKYKKKEAVDNTKLTELMHSCNWGRWKPDISDGGFHYILEDNTGKYLAHIGYISNNDSTTRQKIKSIPQPYKGKRITGKETGGVCVDDSVRGKGHLSELFYAYLNDPEIQDTWLWCVEDKIKLYTKFNFELLYDSTSGTEIKCETNFYMRYTKNKNLDVGGDLIEVSKLKHNSVKNINVFNQINATHYNLCGLYAPKNIIIMNYILKYYNNKTALLNNADVNAVFIDKLKEQFKEYMVQLQIKTKTKVNKLRSTRIVSRWSEYDFSRQIRHARDEYDNLYIVFNDGKDMDLNEDIMKKDFNEMNATQINMFENNKNIDVDFEGSSYYFNTNVLKNNTINIEISYANNVEFCNSVLIRNPMYLELIKNYYKLDNYVLSFLTARTDHWHCVVVNKVEKKVQILFMSSVGETVGDSENEKIFNNIISLINKNTFDDFIQEYFNCMTKDVSLDLDWSNNFRNFIKYSKNIPDFKETLKKIIQFYINPMKCKELFGDANCRVNAPTNIDDYEKKFENYENIIKNVINELMGIPYDRNLRELYTVCKDELTKLLQTVQSGKKSEEIEPIIHDYIDTLNILLELPLSGGSFNYKEKYLKYKTKYLKLKNSKNLKST